MGFYGAPDKKRHLTMARLELLFVNVKHGGIGRHVINNLFNIFESHWRTFVIQVFTFALTNDFDNRFISRCINQLTFKIEASTMVRWPVAICVPATTNATGTTS